MIGDIESAGEGAFEWEARGVGSWGGSVGVGYNLSNNHCNKLSGEIGGVIDGDGGVPGLNDGIAVGMLLVLGFGCANGPEEGANRA